MDKQTIIKYILAYIAISLIINYFFTKKTIKNNDSTVIRIDNNNKIISNKPINIDISLLENKIDREFTFNINENQNNEYIELKNNNNTYIFSSYTGSPIIYKYIQPITKKELTSFDYSSNKSIPPLSIIIDNKVITDFHIDSSNEDKNVVIFYKKYNGYTIVRKYFIKENNIFCEIFIENPNNKNIGNIKIASEEQLLLQKDETEGAFSYNEDEKIIKFLYQNELIIDQSVVLNPEIVGIQSNFFTQAIIQNDNSFIKAFFKKNSNNYITYFLESKKITDVNTKLSFNWYIGPKIYSDLKSIDTRLALIMEYGIFAKISQIFISFLFLLTSIFNNFGIALLLFIILTKLISIPFMPYIKEGNKKNKEFTQKLEYIKAKYHNDPEKKSTEEMELFKKYGMFGGWISKIPQVFNIFILISLQSILKKNIIIYQVPLGLWLTDASSPDQYYILPIIFLIFIYLNIKNNKMTPMVKIAILMAMIFFIYIFSFWASSIQLFIVAGVIAGYLETTYLLI